MMLYSRLLAVCLLAVPAVAAAAPCGGFIDVDSNNPNTSPFCADVEWIRNRSVTLGCGGGGALYCPDTAVTRLAMAAFMRRLGDALTPVTLTAYYGGSTPVYVSTASPDANGCRTADPYTVVDYPRKATLHASWSARSPFRVEMYGVLTYSTDAGNSFQTVYFNGSRTGTPGNLWMHMSQSWTMDLDVGSSYVFGFATQHAIEEVDTDAVSIGVRCYLTVTIASRSGAASPLDAPAPGAEFGQP